MKTILLSLLTLFVTTTCFADQKTTVLDNVSNNGTGKIVAPYLDGALNVDLEANLNKIINEEVAKLVKKAGKNANLSYDVELNRPSLVSIMLKAEGSKTYYKGLNLDLTTGREFTLNDFFVKNEEVKHYMDIKDIIFDDDEVKYPSSPDGAYNNKISYDELIAHVRVGEAGRIFQVARLTDKSADKVLHLDGAGLVAIKLASNPSTGFTWQIAPGKGIKEVGRSFNMPNMHDERVGVPGEEIIVFAVSGKGMHNINFQYKRAWEKSFAQSFKVNIEVD